MRTEHFFKMKGAIALLFSLFMMTSSVSGQDGNDWWKTFGFTKDEKQVWLKAGKSGVVLALCTPTEYGGQGGTILDSAISWEEQ